LPTYQYACTECGHAFEQFQSFSDDALTVCPQCEGRLRKVYNAVGVVFKGSGFYRTDSRTDGDKGGGGGKDGGGKDGSGDGASPTTEKAGKADKAGSGEKVASTSDGGSTKTEKTRGDKAGAGAAGSTSAA
jgi:putative FmdB family regulatory protein